MSRYFLGILMMAVGMVLTPVAGAHAVIDVPASADPARIGATRLPHAPQVAEEPVTPPEQLRSPSAPEGAQNITLILKQLKIEGAKRFTEAELLAPHQARVGTKVTLAEIYAIADAISAYYRAAGYTFTTVEVPDQRVSDGVVRIRVWEGHIARVDLEGPLAQQRVIKAYLERIVHEKPLRFATLEGTLLQLNDLPGQRFRAVLSAMPGGEPGESLLTLIPEAKPVEALLGFDNYGSRYLGPHEVSARVGASLLPLQQTTLYGLTSMPTRELGYGTLRHEATVAPDITVHAEFGRTHARPGYTLQELEIDSTATHANLGISYQWLRSRRQNLSSTFTIEGRNVSSDSFDTPLTRERIRAVRGTLAYDKADAHKGANVANLTLTRGIGGLGSSNKGDENLSRSEAKPEFSKAELYLSRLQQLNQDWAALIQFSGQIASDSLYASEEFGYGGQSFGRAYDASELVGDHGAAAGVEICYGGWHDLEPVNLEPYLFYDYGVVINDDSAQLRRDEAASAGVGIRLATAWGQSANLGVAIPIDHETLAPLYGGNGDSPRAMIQFVQHF